MNPNYYWKLKNPQSTKETSIRLKFYQNRLEVVYGTGLKIHPELWSKESERTVLYEFHKKDIGEKERIKCLLQKHEEKKPNIKSLLENIDTSILNIITFANNYFGATTLQNKKFNKRDFLLWIKEQDDRNSKRPESSNEDHIRPYLDKFIKGIESGEIPNPRNDLSYSAGTVKAYGVLKNKLTEYELSTNKKPTKFDDINLTWYKNFKKWCLDKEQGYSLNYFGNLIKNLKSIMARSLHEKLHTNEEWKRAEFKKIQIKTPSIALTTEEIEAITKVDLSHLPNGYTTARDLFLIGCHTALRVSDYNSLTQDHFIENENKKYINKKTVKTGEQVTIPIKHELNYILNQYNYSPPTLSEQKINKYIKEVAKVAGITRNEIIEGERVPRYSLIRNHTGRRTAITNMKLSGMTTSEIRIITGHRNDKSLETYIKTTTVEDAYALSKYEFFIGEPVMKKVK